MASSLDQIINIVVTQQTAAVPQASFSIPLIVGPNAPRTITAYTTPESMLDDGFTSSDLEYKYAVKLCSQALSPTIFYVGLANVSVAQTDTIKVNTVTALHVYTFSINGHVISYTQAGSDSYDEILNGLLADIATVFPVNPPVSGVVSGSGASTTLTLTSTTAGTAVAYTAIDLKLTQANTLANHNMADDISTIRLAIDGDLWYGLCICSNVAQDILNVAALIETIDKIFIAATADAAVATSSVTDVASVLAGKDYTRTALMYSPASAALGMDAAWLGGQLPQVPGATTWKFKQLVGISPDSLTAAVKTILIGTPGISTGKTVNIYETVGGVNITEEGWMCGGQFIDLTVFIDWLRATMQNNIYTLLIQNGKVPYTDKGIAVIENAVRQTLKAGSDDGGNGGIDHTSIEVVVQSVTSISTANRAARILPSGVISWSARLTGAFHFINISGTVTV